MVLQPLTLVVIVANILGAAMAVPQARKLLRSRSSEGISVSWAAISATVNWWWVIYALGVGDGSIIPVCVVSVIAYLVITGAALRYGPAPRSSVARPAVASAFAIGAIPAIALAVDGWITAGIVLGALYGIQLSPAVVAVYRAIDVGGVSLTTWIIGFVEAALWGVYGLAKLDVGLIALAATGLFMSSLVLVRLFIRRPRRVYASVVGFAPA